MKTSIIFSLLLFGFGAWAQPMPTSLVLGTWEGESVCQVPKPCTTEHVIYEIKDAGSGKVVIKADKVVNGQREWMADLRCTWVATERKLSCPMEGRKPGDWVFTLAGDTLNGTLTLRENNLIFRKISVRRTKP